MSTVAALTAHKTKIVATIGPASRDPAVLEPLIRAGVDVVRLNFSHGEPQEHLAVAHAARAIAQSAGRPLAVLQDLSGPKIRTGRVPQPIELRPGETVVITDRGRPVARLESVFADSSADPVGRLARLERRGLLRRASGPPAKTPRAFAKRAKASGTLDVLLEERRSGR